MRYLSIIFLVIIFASCKKDDGIDHLEMKIGDPLDMKIIHHDSVVQGPYTFNNMVFGPQAQMYLNVDGDLVNDFIFYSYVDTVPNFDGQDIPIYSVTGKAINDAFQFAAIPESGLKYKIDSMKHDYYGTFPRTIHQSNWYCDMVPGAVEPSWPTFEQNSIQPFSEGDYIFEDLNWLEETQNKVIISRNAYEEINCVFSSGGDTLICNYNIFPEMCNSITHNEKFFVVFKKQIGHLVNYGWIEMKLSDNNRLDIYRSAIQL